MLLSPMDLVADEFNEKINDIIHNQESQLLQNSFYLENGHWNEYHKFGSHFTSISLLILRSMNEITSSEKIDLFTKHLLSTQEKNGGWKITSDPTVFESLDATIVNYLAIKFFSKNSTLNLQSLKSAEQFIQKHGGIQESTLLVKYVLSLNNLYSFNKLYPIPFFLISKQTGIVNSIATWNHSYLESLFYWQNKFSNSQSHINYLISQWLTEQSDLGLWDGQAIGSLLIAAALKDYLQFHQDEKIKTAYIKAVNRVHTLLEKDFNQGSLMIGDVWDTLLVLNVIYDKVINQTKIDQFLLELTTPSGGLAYSSDYKNLPDVDTTAMAIKYFSKKSKNEIASKMLSWIYTRQNDDGGFASWDLNQKPNWIFNLVDRITNYSLSQSTTFFDQSWPHITGHVLSAMAATGINVNHLTKSQSLIVNKIFNFLNSKKEVFPDGVAWQGRWEINYLWGTYSVINGLLDIGISPKENTIQQSVRWLLERQNSDGGWGEDSRSFSNKQFAGRSFLSKPTQTAWGLEVLLRTNGCEDQNLKKGLKWLLSIENNGWVDPFTIFTINPGSIYTEYNIYSTVYPLLFLRKYQNKCIHE